MKLPYVACASLFKGNDNDIMGMRMRMANIWRWQLFVICKIYNKMALETGQAVNVVTKKRKKSAPCPDTRTPYIKVWPNVSRL